VPGLAPPLAMEPFRAVRLRDAEALARQTNIAGGWSGSIAVTWIASGGSRPASGTAAAGHRSTRRRRGRERRHGRHRPLGHRAGLRRGAIQAALAEAIGERIDQARPDRVPRDARASSSPCVPRAARSAVPPRSSPRRRARLDRLDPGRRAAWRDGARRATAPRSRSGSPAPARRRGGNNSRAGGRPCPSASAARKVSPTRSPITCAKASAVMIGSTKPAARMRHGAGKTGSIGSGP
jgi:hypothetical protein